MDPHRAELALKELGEATEHLLVIQYLNTNLAIGCLPCKADDRTANAPCAASNPGPTAPPQRNWTGSCLQVSHESIEPGLIDQHVTNLDLGGVAVILQHIARPPLLLRTRHANQIA